MVKDLLKFDSAHIWHPYTGLPSQYEMFEVVETYGVTIKLSDGSTLVDGMSSWWSAIHGYNNVELQKSMYNQIDKFAHVMFGGLTHRPAVDLVEQLIDITPKSLTKVFLADSGSVAVEVALKMALQYQMVLGKVAKNKFVSLRGGYHGDTIGAMSVCDPDNSMHNLFAGLLADNLFVNRPECKFGDVWQDKYMDDIQSVIEKNHDNIAAFILEPIVQGAGGMYFYHPQYLIEIKRLCDKYDILLIADEIATGFGRTGKMFACEWANIEPDILCLGKALTGGTMTLAATLTNSKISEVISSNYPKVLMHGPTFMGNPLACSVAIKSIELLKQYQLNVTITNIEHKMCEYLAPCSSLESVVEVRVLGAIGVIELYEEVDLGLMQPEFVKSGVWVRPFGKLVYIMPSYIISDAELLFLANAIYKVIKKCC